MINFAKLFEASYLFESRPTPDSDLIFALAIMFAVLLILSGGLTLGMMRRERREPIIAEVRRRFTSMFFAVGFVGLILVFFRWQGIPYLGMRVWLLLWIGASFAWLTFAVVYLLKKYPKERRLYDEKRLKERYLPRAQRG